VKRMPRASAGPDVAIVGGGIAGTMLARQLRMRMPGLRITRDGTPRHCQGTVLVDWTAAGPDGQPRGRGTNVFTLAPDGRIEAVTGFWAS